MHLPKVNMKLLPIKAHFFLLMGGTSPLAPFLTTMAKTRGYSAFLVGTVFSVVLAVAILFRPVFGTLSDRYRCHRKMIVYMTLALALVTASYMVLPDSPADANNGDDAVALRTYQFWLFVAFLTARCIASNASVTLSNTMCLQSLGKDSHKFGKQRLWGCIAMGLVSVTSGWLIDWYSVGKPTKDYTPAIILCVVLLLIDVLIFFRVKDCQSKAVSEHMIKDIKKLLNDLNVLQFLICIAFFGIFNTSISLYLFWHIEELVTKYHPEKYSSIKTIQGAVVFVKCFGGEAIFFFYLVNTTFCVTYACGELPFIYVSLLGKIIEKVGHMNSLLIGLATLSVRFLLYFIITDPLWVLSVEVLSGLGYALPYSAMTAYGSVIAPECLKGTIQELIGIVNQGVGVCLGSLITGYLFDKVGSSNAYLVLSIMVLVVCFIKAIIMWMVVKIMKFKMKENVEISQTA